MKAWRDSGIEDTDWDDDTRQLIGKELIDVFISSTGLFNIFIMEGHQVLRPIQDLLEWLREGHVLNESSEYLKLPMVTKPLNWNGVYDGGFIKKRYPLIKTRREESLQLAENSEGIDKVLRALNAIQGTPWRINKRILKILKQCEGKDIAGLPPYKRTLPQEPWRNDTEKKKIQNENNDLYRKYFQQSKAKEVLWYNNRPERWNLKHKVWLADKFKDESEFYFLWNLDWRGRMYPLFTISLHPQSDDSGKGLLEFAQGKKLGAEGAYWLAVHGANCHGESDKKSLDDRVKWVEENEAEIIDSAEKPLEENSFWTDAEEPFQFLAFCFEWSEHKKRGSEFVSHLPIAIDMSCNGLQHLAYLAGDINLSFCVNALINVPHSLKAQDYYGMVADKVNEMVASDAQNGNEIAKLWVGGKVDRPLVKRNVMTLPYGATNYGFMKQLEKEIINRDANSENGSYLGNRNMNGKACSYLAKKSREAIKDMSKNLVKTMGGMQGFVKFISERGSVFTDHQLKKLMIPRDGKLPELEPRGVPVSWVSPIGLTVVQDYRQPDKPDKINTFWGDLELYSSERGFKIDTNASKQGSVPNFIHSRDASHMMMTVLELLDSGIESFSMIHDSFGCHAANAGKMEKIIWRNFGELYREQQEEFIKSVNSLQNN